MAAFLADAIVALHLCIVSFCVVGELAILAGAIFKWRWIRNPAFRLAHLGLVLYVAGESILGVTCPLTEWEYRLRMAAGQGREQNISFVGRLIRSLIFYDFPPAFFTALYVGFGLLVLATCVFVRPRRRLERPG